MSDINTYIVTFGSAHLDKHGNSLQNVIAHVKAKDEGEAREIVFKHRKAKWAFIYPHAELTNIAKHYPYHTVVAIETLNITDNILNRCVACKQEVYDFCPPRLTFSLAPGHTNLIVLGETKSSSEFKYCVDCVVNNLVAQLHEFQNDYIHNHVNELDINGGDNK